MEHCGFVMNIFNSKRYTFGLIVLLLLVILSAVLFRILYAQHEDLIEVQETRYSTYLLTTQLRHSSDDLTRLVRSYAATANPMFEKQFWEVIAIRNGNSPLPNHYDRVYWDLLSVENGKPPYSSSHPVSFTDLMKKSGFTQQELVLLEESHSNSNQLVNLENKAFNAINGIFKDRDGHYTIKAEPDKKMAVDILYSDEYHQAKISIMKPINKFYEALDKRTQQQVNETSTNLMFTLTFFICVFTCLISIIILMMFYTKRYHHIMVSALNKRVKERTKDLNSSNEKLQFALSEIKSLKGIIPICSYCYSIRDKEGAWEQLESYISNHSEARFSHSICPECIPKVYTESGLNEPES